MRHPVTALCGVLAAGLIVPAIARTAGAHQVASSSLVRCAPGVPARLTHYDYADDTLGFVTPELALQGRSAGALTYAGGDPRAVLYVRRDAERPVVAVVVANAGRGWQVATVTACADTDAGVLR